MTEHDALVMIRQQAETLDKDSPAWHFAGFVLGVLRALDRADPTLFPRPVLPRAQTWARPD